MPSQKIDQALEQVHAIYKAWDATSLPRNCTGIAQCCHFSLTGKTPYITRGEALLAAKAWRSSGRKTVPLPKNGSCPFLVDSRCAIYESRPFGCRTHFCQAAGGPAPRAMVRDFIHQLEEIDHTLGGDGGVNLPTAASRAFTSGTR